MDYTYSTTIVNGSTTGIVTDTRKLYSGLYVYGTGMPICNLIESVTNSTTFVLTEPAIQSGTFSLNFIDLSPNQYLERCQALTASQEIINEIGSTLEVIVRTESQLTRGGYNSIRTKTQTTQFHVKAYPLVHNPSSLQLEKAGLRQLANVMATTSKKDWSDNGYDFDDIDLIRMTVKVDGQNYEIKEKTKANQFGSTYLNFNIGMFKK